MKFITESDLRALYKAKPFDTYDPAEGTRLTPGARQFLSDRKIRMQALDQNVSRRPAGQGNANSSAAASARKVPKRMLVAKLKSLENLFLETSYVILAEDVNLAQAIMALVPVISGIRTDDVDKTLSCRPCTGITEENFSLDLPDCFDIEAFHLQTPNARQILMLNKLRCAMHEFCAAAEERVADPVTLGRVHQVVNTLSQMICKAFGGKECQRIQ